MPVVCLDPGDELRRIEDFDALEDVDPDFTEIAMIPRKRAQKGRSESTLEVWVHAKPTAAMGRAEGIPEIIGQANASDSQKLEQSTQPTPMPTPANAG